MKYLALWHPVKNAAPPPPEHYAEMGKLIDEMTKAQVLLDTGGWDIKAPAIVVTNKGGKVTVTDGPYTEAKELVAGYAIFQVKSKEEAVKWGKRFIEIAGDGYSEMREIPAY
ncbi:MAG TPA: YciI family protein [bacterium]|nr:YciI family protein [bacterium]